MEKRKRFPRFSAKAEALKLNSDLHCMARYNPTGSRIVRYVVDDLLGEDNIASGRTAKEAWTKTLEILEA